MNMLNDELIKKRQAYIEKYIEYQQKQSEIQHYYEELLVLEKDWQQALENFDKEVTNILLR